MKGNQEPMLYTTNAAVASLNHVPGFDPLKFLRRTTSRKTGEDVMRLDLRYKKLWFRLACPTGRLKLNALRITEKMAIFEAKVYRDREDAEPLSSYVANCTLDATPGGLYVEAAQEEALDTALSNAGFGIQFTDVGSESEEYGSEVPVGAKAEIAKPVQTKVEVAEPVQKQPESVKATPQESAKTDPLDAIMADDMPVPEQVTAEVVEKPKTVVLESVQSAQTPPEPTQNVIVLEQEPPAAAYKLDVKKTGNLSKQIKSLIDLEIIARNSPINKIGDNKKSTFEINDNLLRFYFTFIYKNASALQVLGAEAFYDEYIAPALTDFISRRFEGICRDYFSHQVRSGKMKGVRNIGSYYYDDPAHRKNGEFDVALEFADGYEIYEAKYYAQPMTLDEIHREVQQVEAIKELTVKQIGFIAINGFAEREEPYLYLDGNDIFANE